MSRHKESFFQRKLLDSSTVFSPSLVSWVSFVVSITGQLGCQTPACYFIFTHLPSWLLRLIGSVFQLPVLVCGFVGKTLTVNVGFVKPLLSHSRFPVGPSCRFLPLGRVQHGRGPERRLWLPLRHSVHHLCATQPVSSSRRHALPSTLRLFSLYENHISKRLGEELHLIQNRTTASSFCLNVHGICVLRPSYAAI